MRYYSLKPWRCIAISLECAIYDICTKINKIWHNWLILWSIPRNISWFSLSISITSFMILMEYWSLSSSPLSMSIWYWWIFWKNSSQIPPKEIWIIQKSSLIELLVVKYIEIANLFEPCRSQIIDIWFWIYPF